MDKEKRNADVFKMFNEGKPEREIARVVGLSKTAVHKILTPLVVKESVSPKIKKVVAKLTGSEERMDSFVGWIRTNVNEYTNKDTAEVVNIAFVKAKKAGEFGYFVKVSGVEKKSTASGNEVKEIAEENLLNENSKKI
jgi:hypothetical protein